MSPEIRRLIGLFQTGVRDNGELAHIMRLEQSVVSKLKKRLLRCKNQVVMSAFRFGLTGDTSVLLREGVKIRCPKCRSMVDRVPCVKCAPQGNGIDLDGWQGQLDPPLVEPAEATDLLPGTPEKIELMRRRVERWEMPCHPQDPKYDPAYTTQTDTMSVNTGDLLAIVRETKYVGDD